MAARGPRGGREQGPGRACALGLKGCQQAVCMMPRCFKRACLDRNGRVCQRPLVGWWANLRACRERVLGAQAKGGRTRVVLFAGCSRRHRPPDRFRARRRCDGFMLALADAPAITGIAQPPKRMPVTRSAPAESAPAAAAVAPTVAAPEFSSAARSSLSPRFGGQVRPLELRFGGHAVLRPRTFHRGRG